MVPLFFNHAAEVIHQILDRAGGQGQVAVLADPRLAKRLAALGHAVTQVPSIDAGDLAGGAFAAVVAPGMARADDWQSRLTPWCDALRPGGVMVWVDRGAASELCRRALCGGLTAVEQHSTGRTLVTAGRWHPL